MKRVLVTGASGFVGRHALAPLAERGYEVHAVCSRVPSMVDATTSARWHKCDLLDDARARTLVSSVRPTHLLHLAWYAVPGEFWTAAENLRWVGASLSLFQAFAEAGGQRIVAAGTCAEYEWGSDETCSELSTPLRPATLYGMCKHSTRAVLEAFAAQSGLSAAWGRVFLLYGPHENPQRLVPYVIRSLLRDEPARCSHGEPWRDFLYVRDVADAFVALLESDVRGAINVASGNPVKLKTIIYKIADKLDRRNLVQLGAVTAPAPEPKLLVADASRLGREVGWSPTYTLDAGVEATISWWRKRMGDFT